MSTSGYAEDGFDSTSDSFYEIGQFKRTVTRIDNGHKQCDDLMAFLRDRASIEDHYVKTVRSWAAKYTKIIEKGSWYHTMQHSLLGMIKESEKIADLHQEINNDLMKDDFEKVKSWKKEHYHSMTLGGLKETKVCNDEFTKAQKPWAKLYKKVNDTKKAYYQSCKEERTAQIQENAAKADNTLPPEKVKKLQEAVEKKSNERSKHRDKYETALSDLDGYNSRYMEDMENAFTKCQEFESERLKFFKEVLLSTQNHLNISNKPQLSETYGNMQNCLNQASADSDLEWWKNNHGPGMAMNWPTFEDYDAERIHMQRNITKKQGKASKHVAGVDGITGAQFTQNSEYTSSYPPPEDNNRPASWSDDDQSNPFESHEGVQVEALYDYDGAEEDELSFRAGEKLIRLEDEDEQGWCKGRLESGIEGLYPANYVKEV